MIQIKNSRKGGLVIFLILISVASAVAEEIDNSLRSFRPPGGFILKSSEDNGISFFNKTENITLVVGVITSYEQDFSKQLRDNRFIRGLIQGQEDTGVITIESHRVRNVGDKSALEMIGQIDIDGVPSFSKKVFVQKNANLFFISLIGSRGTVNAKDDLFEEVMRSL